MPSTRTAPRQTRDAQGNRLCRVPTCLKPVPKGRLSYCSASCATDFEVAYFPSRTRRHVYRRDCGVCGLCGCDTDKLYRVLNFVRGGRRRWSGGDGYQLAVSVARELGFNGVLYQGDFWQADHIEECARGGWGKGLDNFRTLCTPCHKAETKRLAGELAQERRIAKIGDGLFAPRARGVEGGGE